MNRYDVAGSSQDLFIAACKSGNLEVVEYLVSTKSVNIHANDNVALRWASSNDHLEVVQYLVEQGANIHAYNDDSLRRASANGHLEVVQYLKEQIAKEAK